MKIYTRSGDQGETGLFGGRRVSKANARIEAYGCVDELNATLGLARALLDEGSSDEQLDAQLARVQHQLFNVGADLATPQGDASEQAQMHIRRVQASWVGELEEAIDAAERRLEPLRNFILPGGAPGTAALHLARTVCRRAERRVVALSEKEEINPAVVVYLNRLSDLLFVLARLANQQMGVADLAWQPGGGSE
jgi:cob(I)alamin adenosyltransferase